MTREDNQIAQGIVGVRVVDNDDERLPRIDRLKATGNGFEARNEFGKLGERNTARMGSSKRGEQVEDVDFAGKLRHDLRRAGWGFEIEDRSAGGELEAGDAPISLRQFHRFAPRLRPCAQLRPVPDRGVHGIDDGYAWRGVDDAIEQLRLAAK